MSDEEYASSPSAYRRFCVTLLGIAGLGMLIVAGLNFFVDPYGAFGMNGLGVYTSDDRTSKASLYRSGKFYEAVVLGNGQAGVIPAAELDQLDFFSATFHHAGPEELYYFADRHLFDGDVAIVVLDLLSFDDAKPIAPDPFGPTMPDVFLERLLSLNALEDSLNTMRRNAEGEVPNFAKDGSLTNTSFFKEKLLPDVSAHHGALLDHERAFDSFVLSITRISYLERLSRVLDEHRYATVAVIAPMHREVLERLPGTNAEAALSEWKANIMRIFPETIDLMDSEYSAPINFLPGDPTYLWPEVGAAMINERVIAELKLDR